MDRNAKRLYELIWKRAIASQMADAELERTTASIQISTSDKKLTASGEVVKFEGFLKVYMESKDDDQEEDEESSKVLPPLKVGQALDLKELNATQTFTRHPSRYTEPSLVKQLGASFYLRPNDLHCSKKRICC